MTGYILKYHTRCIEASTFDGWKVLAFLGMSVYF